jgi:hypothetical protein
MLKILGISEPHKQNLKRHIPAIIRSLGVIVSEKMFGPTVQFLMLP